MTIEYYTIYYIANTHTYNKTADLIMNAQNIADGLNTRIINKLRSTQNRSNKDMTTHYAGLIHGGRIVATSTNVARETLKGEICP
jgi:hypothetical protein